MDGKLTVIVIEDECDIEEWRRASETFPLAGKLHCQMESSL